MKKIALILTLLFLILSACGDDEAETEKDVEVKEEAEAKEKAEAKAKEMNDSINNFDNLSQAIKAHLATSIVDDRAYAHDLTGFTLYYNIEGDNLFVQVHSGAGVGHPVYRIQLDSDSITPIDGVVNVSAANIEETTLNSSTISKKDLYNHYSKNKDVYEAGESNVEHADHLNIEYYESMKDEIQ